MGGAMLVSFSVVPYGVGESVGKYVSEVIRLVDESGLPYRLCSMNTEVEGSYDQVMDLVKRCHAAMLEVAPRVITSIKIDDRPERDGKMLSGKIGRIEGLLGREAKRDQ
jgi:uncharacterized protein (TIGR00106 family)